MREEVKEFLKSLQKNQFVHFKVRNVRSIMDQLEAHVAGIVGKLTWSIPFNYQQ